MRSLWEKSSREELLHRMEQLRSESSPQWGKFNCQQMLAHVADGLRMALGDLPVASKFSPLKIWPFNSLVIYWLPFPKGVPTAPELISRQAESIDGEKRAIKELLAEFAGRDEQGRWVAHPVFGNLNGKDWGVLIYRHIDHHWTQFGV